MAVCRRPPPTCAVQQRKREESGQCSLPRAMTRRFRLHRFSSCPSTQLPKMSKPRLKRTSRRSKSSPPSPGPSQLEGQCYKSGSTCRCGNPEMWRRHLFQLQGRDPSAQPLAAGLQQSLGAETFCVSRHLAGLIAFREGEGQPRQEPQPRTLTRSCRSDVARNAES